jgi:3-carboxy-cis,cis-muconate cycloisomerase
VTALHEALFSTPQMEAVFSDVALLQRLLDFEAALARAEARAGIVPPEAARAIVAACRAERFDLTALARAAATAGTPAIPLVQRLSELAGEAGTYVHWGATSQDALDTALVLQVRDGLDLLDGGLLRVGTACAGLAERQRHTLMAGRTLLQQALPITFGLKAARWLALVTRRVRALRMLRDQVLVVQLGGAAGTLAALGEHGIRVQELLAAELGLAVPELPWHAERDRVAELGAALGIAAGAMAKIARDLVLLAQTEVGEVAEAAAPGKGGSSTLPHKRNPVDATFALAAAQLALGQVSVLLGGLAQEHERAAGGWQAEWAAVPTLFCATAGAVDRVRKALEGLEINPARMRANLELGGGLLMAEALATALAPHLGRPEAQRLARAASERAVAAGLDLRRAALDDPRVGAVLSPAEIDRALDPAAYLGSAHLFIQRALDGFRALGASAPPTGG